MEDAENNNPTSIEDQIPSKVDAISMVKTKDQGIIDRNIDVRANQKKTKKTNKIRNDSREALKALSSIQNVASRVTTNQEDPIDLEVIDQVNMYDKNRKNFKVQSNNEDRTIS